MANTLKALKKPLRALALAIALGASFVLLVFTFIIHDALDKTEKAVVENIEGIQKSLVDIESALGNVENELDSANKTISEFDESFRPLASGLSSTGEALEGISDTLSVLSIPGIGVTLDTSELDSAAASIRESATNLNETDFDEHTANIGGLKDSISQMKDDITSQRMELEETKTTVEDVIGLMKIANILFFFVIISMFAMIILNSTAGLI